MAKEFLGVLDKFIAENSDSILKENLSRVPKYEYRCGKRRRRDDPRLKVRHMVAMSVCRSLDPWLCVCLMS